MTTPENLKEDNNSSYEWINLTTEWFTFWDDLLDWNPEKEVESNDEKVKKRYGDLREKIGKLDNCTYIDEEWYKVALLSTASRAPKKYRDILKWKKWIIVIKEDMKTWTCYITNVFYKNEYKRWMISWIQKSIGGEVSGWKHGTDCWTITLDFDWETAGFQKSDNLDGKDISPILGKIYSRYLDIMLPTQKQKNQETKIMLDRVENNNKENDADEFLDQALENMA